jgi:3-(3-hydroxy-phenyl)propionate hydroxylase
LIRPDGYVAWVGDRTQLGLADALTTWFGPPRERSSTAKRGS